MLEFKRVKQTDLEIFSAMSQELERQRNNIELIASENFISEAVMEAMGSHLTNKYAEGYPGRRYYDGCKKVDIAETLAIERAKKLFGADHANVQPHSGAQANTAVFFALLKPGDTVLGMNLAHGGHLTHGSPVNFSGKMYNFVPYGVGKETGLIDYDELRAMAREHRPKLILAGATAYSRIIDFAAFGEIAKETGAYLMVDMAHIAGLIATGHHPSPIPHADIVTSTTHKTLRGPRGGLILCKAEHAKAIDKAVFPGMQGGPLMHIIAAKAVAFREAMDDSFKDYIGRVVKNAAVLAEGLKARGFEIVSGGTDNHLMLVDLRKIGVTGKDAARMLDEVGITCNKNAVPFDTQSPFITSGIRLGTPAMTTRGFVEADADEVAELIRLALTDFDKNQDEVRSRGKALNDKYPMYA